MDKQKLELKIKWSKNEEIVKGTFLSEILKNELNEAKIGSFFTMILFKLNFFAQNEKFFLNKGKKIRNFRV